MTKKSRTAITRAKKVIAQSRFCHLATTAGKQPQVRPMAFVTRRNGEIWFSTLAASRKIKQLKKNPNAEVYFADDKGMHCKIDGKCTMSNDPADKKKQWRTQPELAKFFVGPEDPALVIIKFKPSKYEFMTYGDSGYEVSEV